jgi:hypothetical protein
MRIVGKDRAYVIGALAEGGKIAKVGHRSLTFLRGRAVAAAVAWATRWGVAVELSGDERGQVAGAGDPPVEGEWAAAGRRPRVRRG